MPRKLLRTALGALILAAACNTAGKVSRRPPATTTTTTVPLTANQAAAEFNSCLGEQGLVVPDIPVDDARAARPVRVGRVSGQNPAGWRAALSSLRGRDRRQWRARSLVRARVGRSGANPPGRLFRPACVPREWRLSRIPRRISMGRVSRSLWKPSRSGTRSWPPRPRLAR